MRAAAEWDAWTTTARVVLDHPDRRHLAEAEASVRRVVAAVDDACSRFRDDSELVARTAELERGAAVSPLLATLVQHALDAAHATGGDVDPTLGRHMVSLGYDAAFAGMAEAVLSPLPDHAPLLEDPRPAWRRIMLTGTFLRVPEGVRLDLGATAKAAAADMAAASIAARLGIGVLVSLGGDVATAGPEPRGGWQVTVRDTDDDPEQRIRLAAGWAVATSSTQHRRWERDGERRHHILDPRWGLPAAPIWRSVTVVAPTCVAANTLTTAAVVRGAAAPSLLRERGRAARLVSASGEVVRLNGWPADDGDDEHGDERAVA
jgi:FAD:protein FMN transferase